MNAAEANATVPAARTTITRDEILCNDGILRSILGVLRPDRLRGWLCFIAAVAVPLIVLGAATIHEGRFAKGSVAGPSPEFYGRWVRGMSFVGDTMVWPYIVLIPLLIMLLNLTINRFEVLFNDKSELISKVWLTANSAEYVAILGTTRKIASGEGRGWQRVKWVAVALGIIFLLWNTITCTFANRFKPYETSSPFVEVHESNMPITTAIERVHPQPSPRKYVQIQLDDSIEVPKWDTDRDGAPLSWLSARVWVLLLGYFWIPMAVYKLLNLVAATHHFTNRLATYEGALNVSPLAADDGGSLEALSSLALAFTYPIVCFGIMGVMPYFKEGINASVHDLILFVPIVPVFLAVFFVPLLGVHRAMVATRRQYQQTVAALLQNCHERFLISIGNTNTSDAQFTRLQLEIRGLIESHERGAAMPVWPLEMSTLYRLVTAAAIPVVLPAVIKYALEHLHP
jgi:hypothetical protein